MSLNFFTIDYREPTLWIGVAIASILCWFAARRVMPLTRSARAGVRIAAWSGAVLGIFAAYVLPHIMVQIVFALLHGNGHACTDYVTGAMLIPVVVWIVAAAHAARAFRLHYRSSA